MESLIKLIPAEMIIIVPFLNGIGTLIKKALEAEQKSKAQKLICNVVKDTKGIPGMLCVISMVLSTIYGLISKIPMISEYGVIYWLLISLVWIGMVAGCVLAFIAMGLYDTTKK